MINSEFTQQALELPTAERLDLARKLVESVITPDSLSDQVQEGIRRINEVASGQVIGLSEKEFQDALN